MHLRHIASEQSVLLSSELAGCCHLHAIPGCFLKFTMKCKHMFMGFDQMKATVWAENKKDSTMVLFGNTIIVSCATCNSLSAQKLPPFRQCAMLLAITTLELGKCILAASILVVVFYGTKERLGRLRSFLLLSVSKLQTNTLVRPDLCQRFIRPLVWGSC